MSKVEALRDCFDLSGWGTDLRSKSALFRIGLLNKMDPLRRKPVLNLISDSLVRASQDGLIEIRLQDHLIFLRADDRGDYQSLNECLGSMYPPPTQRIHYLFDAGGNIGFFTIAALHRVPSIRDVIIVEPNPMNLPILRRNLAVFQNVTL